MSPRKPRPGLGAFFILVLVAAILYLLPSLGRRRPADSLPAPIGTPTWTEKPATPQHREPTAHRATASESLRTPEPTSSPTPAAAGATVALAPRLGSVVAREYRERAQYPPWSHPLEEGEDPILRDREVSPVVAGGPEGEEPLLVAFPEKTSFEAPEPVLLYAYLTVEGGRVPAQEIRGTLLTETMQPLGEFRYRDDGKAGDAIAGDLLYTARVRLPEEFWPELAESFLVRVEAVTEEGLERSVASGFLYSVPAAVLTGRFRDSLEDGNLVVDSEVRVHTAGRFHLEATLYSEDGRHPIAWAQTAAELAPGNHWMRLVFFGRAIRTRGIDGPYLLRFVALSTTTTMPNAKNRLVEDAHRTKAYSADDFREEPYGDPDLLEAAERAEKEAEGPGGLLSEFTAPEESSP
ncbi:MAG: hypothetical protein KatS3mg076_3193 [Candidatus Binatia bacterium]|nr:MAG: hypothetical protein KatS3mg076_3193 [Candidatus Binatia bacterium]